MNLRCTLHLMSAHGSATAKWLRDRRAAPPLRAQNGPASAEASVMAPSPFAVKLSVGAVGAVEALGSGGALSEEVVVGEVLSPASPSPGGAAAACSPSPGGCGAACSLAGGVLGEVLWAGRDPCSHASHALARGAVPATASGPFAHQSRAHESCAS